MLSGWNLFAPNDVLECLPFADQMGSAVTDQHFGRQRLAVVVAAHHIAIGSGDLEAEQFSHLGRRQLAGADDPAVLLGENVAGFTQWAPDDYVAKGPLRAVRATPED